MGAIISLWGTPDQLSMPQMLCYWFHNERKPVEISWRYWLADAQHSMRPVTETAEVKGKKLYVNKQTTNSMEQSPSWEADRFWASQKNIITIIIIIIVFFFFFFSFSSSSFPFSSSPLFSSVFSSSSYFFSSSSSSSSCSDFYLPIYVLYGYTFCCQVIDRRPCECPYVVIMFCHRYVSSQSKIYHSFSIITCVVKAVSSTCWI